MNDTRIGFLMFLLFFKIYESGITVFFINFLYLLISHYLGQTLPKAGSHYAANLLQPAIASRCKKLENFLTFLSQCTALLRFEAHSDKLLIAAKSQ